MNKLISSLFALGMSCFPASKQKQTLPDSFPPSLELILLHEKGDTPDFVIVADDEHNLLYSFGKIPNANHSTQKPSSGLQRIELYENFELRETIQTSGPNVFTSYAPPLHREGSFTYRAVVYDHNGNKTDSHPIELTFYEGVFFTKEIVTQDKERPTIDILKVMESGVIIGASDNVCVRRLKLVDKFGMEERYIQNSPSCQTLGTRWGLVLHGNYTVQAEDYAGNKTSAPFDFHH